MNNTTLGLSHILQRYTSRTAILEEFAPSGQLVERIVTPFWYIIGFIGNPISAVIWLGQRMRRNNSSAIYLGALSISDLLFLFLHFLQTLHFAWGFDVYNTYIICEIFYFLYYILQYLSTFLVLGFTVERYVAVCHPFLKEKLCTVKRAVMVVVCLTLFSTGLASAQIYFWTFSASEGTCNIRSEATTEGSTSFWSIWTWITDIFAFVIVPLIVLIFNILVLREIFKISKNDLMQRQQCRSGNSTASTVTLLAVSFYLIITQISATVVVCLQSIFPHGNMFMDDDDIRSDKTWSHLFTYLDVRKVIEVICLSHYACYFCIYCVTGKHFRKEVVFLVTIQGRLRLLASVVCRRRRKERYSMVSTNGVPMSETFTTAFSTAI